MQRPAWGLPDVRQCANQQLPAYSPACVLRSVRRRPLSLRQLASRRLTRSAPRCWRTMTAERGGDRPARPVRLASGSMTMGEMVLYTADIKGLRPNADTARMVAWWDGREYTYATTNPDVARAF